eukprot:TRINITY_DN5625_c0_g1_i1.p1 TRINITY_DN5625_c0_g1~~TRINITY_DN5625_c0_g1_i1.p1  ORF type:complete len:620 (+),score=254.53 TRINITY_DN5625_c0_g1_i1:23-1861(+)
MQQTTDNHNMIWTQDASGKFVRVPRESMYRLSKMVDPRAIPTAVPTTVPAVAVSPSLDNDDPEHAYVTIQQDPRYKRFLTMLSPGWNGKGLAQKARNYIDPSHIPVFGTLVHAYRAGKRGKTANTLENLVANSEESGDKSEVVTALKNMQSGAKVEGIKEATATAVSALFMVFPINAVIPVEDAAGQVVGAGVKKGVKKGVEVTAKKTERDRLDDERNDKAHQVNTAQDIGPGGELNSQQKKNVEEEETDLAKNHSDQVIDSWGEARAFLLYLGLPRDNDVIYSLWEPSRLKLKTMFGGEPESDLWAEKENKLTKDSITSISKGELDVNSLQIPLLEILWSIFECRSLPYYHRVLEKPNRKENERPKDEKYYRRVINNADPRAILLETCHLDMVANILTQPNNIFGVGSTLWKKTYEDEKEVDEKESEKRKEYMLWFSKVYVKLFMEKEEVWGLVDKEDDNRLLGVMIWEPIENDLPSLDRTLLTNKPMGSIKFGLGTYNTFQKGLKMPKKLRKKVIAKATSSGVVHCIAMNQSLPVEQMNIEAQALLSAVLDINSEISYAFVYKTDPSSKDLTQYGFTSETDSEYPELEILKCQGKWKQPTAEKIHTGAEF